MKLIYTPEEGKRREFVFRPGRLLAVEAELLEEAGGASWQTFTEYGDRFMSGHFKARRAALWIMLKRETPKLKLSDVEVHPDELDIAWEPAEADRLKAVIEAADDLDEDERERELALIEMARGMPFPEPPGKDEAAESDTSGP